MKKLSIIFALLISPLWAQNISVQWTTSPAGDFVPVKNWEKTPAKPDPESFGIGRSLVTPTHEAGWVAAIRIGRRVICCCDHYAVIQSKNNVTSYCWRDGHWYPNGAEVCTYRPELDCQYYGDWHQGNVGQSPVHEIRLAWDEFVAPPEKFTRHGLTVGNGLWLEHKAFWVKQ